ncbi:MAG: hypothetical protein M5R40_11755 [Anaerolineae bacterium]|nr:hypothetical protein [Anaerolineae bacterium]
MRRFTVLLLVAILSLTAFGASAQEERVLIVGISEDYNGLDPHRAYEPGGSLIHTSVYDTLVTFPHRLGERDFAQPGRKLDHLGRRPGLHPSPWMAMWPSPMAPPSPPVTWSSASTA